MTRIAQHPGVEVLSKKEGRDIFIASSFFVVSHLEFPRWTNLTQRQDRNLRHSLCSTRANANARLCSQYRQELTALPSLRHLRAHARVQRLYARGTEALGAHTPSDAIMIRAFSPGGTSNVRISGLDIHALAQFRSPARDDGRGEGV